MDSEIPDILHGGTPESNMEGLGLDDSRFCFLLIFITFIGSLLIVSMDAEADVDVGANTESVMSDGTSDYIGGYQYGGVGGRQMNGTLWKFRTYKNPADAEDRIIWGWFTNNDGDDWYKINIHDSSDPIYSSGEYPLYVYDVVMLSNNSIILAVGLVGPFTNPDIAEAHLFCHWNNSDLSQWERVLVYSEHDTTDFGMNVNATDGIVFAVEYFSVQSLWSYKFNPSTRETTLLGYKDDEINLLDKIYVFWNGTAWTLCYQYEPGSGDRLYIYNEDFSTLIHTEPSIASTRTISDLVLTGDGTYVYVYGNDGGGWPELRYWNETGNGIRQYLSYQSMWSVRSYQIALKNDDDTKIKIYGYYFTDDEFHEWAWLDYYVDRDVYKNNHQKWWEETSDWGSGINFVDWAPYKLYPQIWDPINETYIHTQLQNNGTWNMFQECDPDDDPDFWSTGPYPDMATRGYSIWPDIPWGEPENFPPEFSSESPTNGTTGVALQPWCHVTIEDPDGDTFNVTWYENSTGSWVQRQQNLTTSNGTFWWRFTQASSYSTTYYWKLVANDTNGNENTTIYHFTTLGNTPPVGSSPFPSNGSSGITPTPTCRITVLDANGDPMDISWFENTTGSWVERHADSGVSNGTFSFQFTQFSGYSTTYYWRINLTDGTDNVTYIFHFTTMDNLAPIVVFPSPGNGSTSSPSPTTSITVGDIDSMDVDWLEWTGGSWVLRQRSTGISSGVYTWVFSGATEDDETYYWAVNATDGSLNTTKVFHFTVEITTPTEDDEDNDLNLETLDYGMFIGLAFLIIVVMIAGLGAIVKFTRDDV